MARPSNTQEFDVPVDLNPLPPAAIDGIPNPEYYRVRVSNINRIAEGHASRGLTYSGYEQHLKGLKLEAELHGIDPKTVMDSRSDAQIFEDCIHKLLDSPTMLFEATDAELDAITKGMDRCELLVDEAYQDEKKKAGEQGRKNRLTATQIKQLRELGKAIRDRISRVRRLRERAKNPVPAGTPNKKHKQIEAAHTLRFMLYVGRSQTSDLGIDGTTVFDIGPPHARMALAYWEARNGIYFSAKGAQRNVIPYEGVMIVMPPGHGKTEYGIHTEALAINHDPKRQTIMLHAQSEIASEMKQYVSKFFDPSEPVGRRNLALFPGVELHKKDNNAHSMRLVVRDETLRAPTIRAHGVGDKASGRNCTDLYIDDPVDESERDSEADRTRKWKRIENTWFPRKRGHAGMIVWITTLWHEDDASCRKIAQAKLAAKTNGKKGVMFRVLRIGAGGPKEQFAPVWKRAYNKEYLRRKFQSMGPIDYATVYQCNPASREAAIVKKLALYAPTMPDGTPNEQHQRFLAGGVRHLSIDPAATNRESSDRAGVIYAAHGDLQWQEGSVHHSVPRLRIISGQRLRATQSEVVEEIAEFARVNRVDYIYCETVSGFAATAEMFENQYDIDVIRLQPTNKKKEVRLRNCQVMLDDSHRDKGIIPVVEFPGKWDKGASQCTNCGSLSLRITGEHAICSECDRLVDRLVPDDSIEWLVNQLTRFGVVNDDDGVDALTQLALHIAPDLGVGEGVASQVIKAQVRGGDSRKLRVIRSYRESLNRSQDFDTDEWNWHARQYG